MAALQKKKIPAEKSFLPLDEEERYFMDLPLDPREEIIEGPVYESVIEAAVNYNNEKKSISIKMPVAILSKLKAIGKRDAIPYQTLLISIAKKYTEGRLIEKE